MAADNFFSSQININSDGSVFVSGAKNTGFLGDNYQAAIATFNATYDYTGIEIISGGLLHSNCGEITQTPSGNFKLIRYNYSGDFFDMAVGVNFKMPAFLFKNDNRMTAVADEQAGQQARVYIS